MCCQYIGKGLRQMPHSQQSGLISTMGGVFPFILPVLDTERSPGEMLQAAVWCSIFSILGNVFRASEPEDATFVFILASGMFRVDKTLFFFLINHVIHSVGGRVSFRQVQSFICISKTSNLLRKFVFHTRESAVFWYFLASREKIVLDFISMSFLYNETLKAFFLRYLEDLRVGRAGCW